MDNTNISDKETEIIKGINYIHEHSPLAQSLNTYFQKWRPELVKDIKPKAAPPVRDFRLKENK